MSTATVWSSNEHLSFSLLSEWSPRHSTGSVSQRQGVGSMLLEHAKWLRAAGFTLWVFQRNMTARGFYEKRGLKPVRLTDGVRQRRA